MANRKLLSALLLATPLMAAPLLAHSAPYNIKQLGVSAGTDSRATSINNAGTVVGVHHPGEDGQPAAFLAGGGKVSYPGFFSIGGINDQGVVSGSSSDPWVETWQHGQATRYNDFGIGGEGGRINNAGAVAGVAWTSTGYRAAVFANGTTQNLGTLYGGDSYAYDINDSGVVVGSSSTAPGALASHAFVYANGVMTDIGTLAGDSSSNAWAINAGGAVAGYSANANGYRAFVYQGGTMLDLGALTGHTYSMASGINDAGQVVGWGMTGNSWGAFLYSDGAMTDLNTLVDPALGWTVQKAFDINENGDIAAKACKAGLGCEIVVLTMAPVPEPETYAMLLAGFGLLGFVARRQRRATKP